MNKFCSQENCKTVTFHLFDSFESDSGGREIELVYQKSSKVIACKNYKLLLPLAEIGTALVTLSFFGNQMKLSSGTKLTKEKLVLGNEFHQDYVGLQMVFLSPIMAKYFFYDVTKFSSKT